MEFPQKAFENEARRAPLAAQERVTRSGCHFARSQTPFNWDLLGKNLNALLAVDWIETVRWFSDILSRLRLVNQRIGFLLFAAAVDLHGVWHGWEVSGCGERGTTRRPFGSGRFARSW